MWDVIFSDVPNIFLIRFDFRNYNPVERRSKVCKERDVKVSQKNSKSLQTNNSQNPGSGDKLNIPKISGTKQRPSIVAVESDCSEEIQALSIEITELKVSVDLLEKERDYYFCYVCRGSSTSLLEDLSRLGLVYKRARAKVYSLCDPLKDDFTWNINPTPTDKKAYGFEVKNSTPRMCNNDEGFFNFTSRRPHHLLQILELGYNVMYNDVDMVWLADPFPYLEGNHDAYFMDDMSAVCRGGFFEQQFSSPASSKIVATPSRSPTIGSTEKRETRDSVSEREQLFGNRRNTNFPTINFKIEKVRKLTMRKRREGESALHHCLQNQNRNHRVLKISL